MKPSMLAKVLPIAIKDKSNILLVGSPGIGKSEMIASIVKSMGYKFMILHPVMSDPTDFKGLPVSGTINGKLTADFIPYGDLREMMETKEELVVLIDDLGQANLSNQAACQQLIQAREINGKRISDYVSFIAATNSRKDNAGVGSLITPLISRFCIFEMEICANDWISWAMNKGLPMELISFINFKPALLNTFTASKEIQNFACPRTVYNLSKWIQAGIIDLEVFKGTVGEGFAVEFMAFYRTFKNIGNLPAQILANPMTADIPSAPDVIYSVLSCLSVKCNRMNIDNIFAYGERIPQEYCAFMVNSIITRNPDLKESAAFVRWAVKNPDVIQ